MPNTTKVLAGLCFLTALGVLFSTLWPFNPFPHNRVSWLGQTDGVRFARSGIVFSQMPLDPAGRQTVNKPCTLELWIRPTRTDSVYTIVNFYEPDNPWRFRLRQYQTGLIISHDVLGHHGTPKRIKVDVDPGLQPDKLYFISVTSGAHGTSVYLDGKFFETFLRFHISRSDLSGQLFLGSSTAHLEPWSGEIHGFAVYSRELSANEVLASYQDWTKSDPWLNSDPNSTIARFTFSERGGDAIRNQTGAATSLTIPMIYRVPYHSFLTPPWREFDPSWSYFWDLVRNIVGFMPLGFLLCALLSLSMQNYRAVLYSVFSGAALSLCIEVLQAYIPQRESGMTDIITNTLGAALGALLVRFKVVQNNLKKKRLDVPVGS